MKLVFRRAVIATGLTALALAIPVIQADVQKGVDHSPVYGSTDGAVPIIASKGMVSAREKLATQVGADILARGGNAVDSAVAVGLALAVTYPIAGNIGGGGFMVIHLAKENKTTTIDYREMAAGTASHDLYIDENGNIDRNKALWTRLATGVPGTIAGMAMAIKKYGTLSWKEVVEPAYKLAKNGFEVSYELEKTLRDYKKRLIKDPEARRIFYKKDGSNYRKGDILVQKDLANTLYLIMTKGPEEFYKGKIARLIAKDMADNDGLITKKDMAAYKAYERDAVFGTYKGYTIASMGPPSSGGVHIIQMLNMLENDNLKEKGVNSAATLHLYIEAMRQAYADRSLYAGDPGFSNVPVEQLIDKAYAQKMRARIPMDRARKSSEVAPTKNLRKESLQTTHYSVMDRDGNAVSNTYTINARYGNGIVAKGTGILLNNELNDFDHLPYEPDKNGNISGQANAQEPHKRPRSSMSPTIVLKDGKAFLLTGSPGGSTIINTVFQTIMNVIEFDMNVAAATNKARIHHSWMPDVTLIEHSINRDTVNILKAMGHNLKYRNQLGDTNSIMYRDGYFYGADDPRSYDSATIGLD